MTLVHVLLVKSWVLMRCLQTILKKILTHIHLPESACAPEVTIILYSCCNDIGVLIIIHCCLCE
jgi:hypothetical protein